MTRIERLDTLCAAAMLVLLLWPALWNGFPLIFPDTGGYLTRALDGTLTMGRSALYGVFLAAGLSFDFWPNVILQAVATTFVLRAIFRTHGFENKPILALLITLVLAALTSLPWYVAQLMPDIFVGLAVLALYLIAFRREALGALETWALGLLIALAIASHMGTLALCLGLVGCFGLLRLADGRIGLPGARLAAPALAVAAGVLLAPTSNYLIAREFAFTPGGTSFLFGRVLQDGLIKRYLNEHCPDAAVELCAHSNELPATADEWLWTYASPIQKLGGWRGYEPEARRLIAETLRLYPGAHLRTAIQASLAQFVAFRTTLSVLPGDNIDTIVTLARALPADANARFLAARQQQQPDVSALNLIHQPVALASLVLMTAVILGWRPDRFGPPTRALCITVLLALFGNAIICGVFSNPNDRYQNRLVWTAVLATAVAAGNWLQRAKRADEQPRKLADSRS